MAKSVSPSSCKVELNKFSIKNASKGTSGGDVINKFSLSKKGK